MKHTMSGHTPMRMLLLMIILVAGLTLSACTFVIEAEPTPVPPVTQTPAPEAETALDPALLATWQWESGILQGQPIEIADPSRYTLTFQADGSVGAQFDCNSGGGEYTVEGESLTFGAMMTTLMACADDTQDWEFSTGLADTVAYAIDGDTLTLILGTDGDSMTFSRVAE